MIFCTGYKLIKHRENIPPCVKRIGNDKCINKYKDDIGNVFNRPSNSNNVKLLNKISPNDDAINNATKLINDNKNNEECAYFNNREDVYKHMCVKKLPQVKT